MLGAMDVRYAWEFHGTEHPRPVEVVRLEAFCNTIDRHTYGAHAEKPDHRRDLLSTPEDLAQWLASIGLLRRADGDVTAVVDARDLHDARALRDGLRAWLQARQELSHDGGALRHAQQVLDRLHLRVGLESAEDATGHVTLDAVDEGVAGAFARLAADLATAQATGTLQRLKICSASDCRFVFYDHSRSRTSRWCSMETCGNRVKTRRYRQRHRQDVTSR